MAHLSFIVAGFPFILLIGTLWLAPEVHAQNESPDKQAYLWRLCPNEELAPLPEPPPDEAPETGELHISADTVESVGEAVSVLSGDVTVIRPADRVAADRLRYSQTEGHMELSGDVRYRGEDIQFNAESMAHDTTGLESRAEELEFFLPGVHARGGAENLERDAGGIIELYGMTYTTCPPDKPFWQFGASHLTLDREEGFGVARHMTLRLKDVPVLYFPVVSFPIDDRRKSGFLFPTVGDSSRHGFELEAPWYWNIAPQADATLTPHAMSRRGVKLDTEWRYLNRWSENRLGTAYLDDEIFGDVRSLVAVEHRGRLGAHWATALNGAEVSDSEYFEDFGDSIADTGRSYLARTARLTGRWEHWTLASRLQSYQSLDERITGARLPYRLAPDVDLRGIYPDFGAGLDFELQSSYTAFDHNERVNAGRLDVWPRLSRMFGGAGWFITPAVGRRYTHYRLEYPEGMAPPAGQDLEPVRSVPVSSLDAGLIFERALGEDRYLQTLEPRIFYLDVPFRDQDDIPVFDTRRPDFSLFQLFEENRFVGADRMGDTRQLSVALSSRFLERLSGEEKLRLSLGQIRYYEDRQVTLQPGSAPDTAARSGLILEAESRFAGAWSATLSGERNPDTDRMDQGLFRLRYARENRHVFNLSYRYRRPEPAAGREGIRQTDVSFNLPLGRRWSVAGRWNYEIDQEVELEKFFGVEYESCCWAFRLMGRRFLVDASTVDPADVEFDEGIYFELSLKGLGQPGSGVGRRLEQSIIGYQDPFK